MSYIKELVKQAVVNKDARSLGHIVTEIEAYVGEDVFESSCFDMLFETRDKLGEEQCCKEICRLLPRYGFSYVPTGISDFCQLFDFPYDDTENFYAAIMDFLFSHSDMSSVPASLVSFIEENCGEFAMEEIEEMF